MVQKNTNDENSQVPLSVVNVLQEQFLALQDEVDLLKIEIKQILVDLREFMLKGRSAFPRSPGSTNEQFSPSNQSYEDPQMSYETPDSRHRGDDQDLENSSNRDVPAGSPGEKREYRDVAERESLYLAGRTREVPRELRFQHQETPEASITDKRQNDGEVDVGMLGNLLWWLGSVRGRGLSSEQVAPFVQAYQAMSYLTPVMGNLIIRALSELDQLDENFGTEPLSSRDYLECLHQLHDIVCTPGYRQFPPLSLLQSDRTRRIEATP